MTDQPSLRASPYVNLTAPPIPQPVLVADLDIKIVYHSPAVCLRAGNLLLGVARLLDVELHVGLAGGQPDIAKQDIPKDDRLLPVAFSS